jgi:hypothetical protein
MPRPQPSEPMVQLTVKVPASLREQIDERAKRDGLTRSTWMVARLTEAATGARPARSPAAAKCDHPMHRRSKGICFACGEKIS